MSELEQLEEDQIVIQNLAKEIGLDIPIKEMVSQTSPNTYTECQTIHTFFMFLCEMNLLDHAKKLWQMSMDGKLVDIDKSLHGDRRKEFDKEGTFPKGFINIHARGDWPFLACCMRGNLKVIEWLLEISLGKYPDDIADKDYADKDYAGKPIKVIDIHCGDDGGFVWSCMCGHFKLAEYLWKRSLGKYPDDIADKDYAGKPIIPYSSKSIECGFCYAASYEFLDIADWLWKISLGNYPNDTADKNYAGKPVGYIDIHQNDPLVTHICKTMPFQAAV